MPDDDFDDFEGIEMNGPWGDVRIGSGGARFGRGGREDDPEARSVRRSVRRKLGFGRNLLTFVAVVGGLALLDWATGGGWWVQWVAGIWGAILVLQFYGAFIAPSLWGRDIEERLVQRELERRRGRVSVSDPPREG